MAAKQPFVYPEMRMVFVLLVVCFAAWGVAANMTDLIRQQLAEQGFRCFQRFGTGYHYDVLATR